MALAGDRAGIGSSPRRFQAVLFDLDGTLIDTRRLYHEAYERAFVDLLDEPPSFREVMARRPTSERVFLTRWLGAELGNRVHSRMCEIYEELAPLKLLGFFDGVLDVVHELRRQEIKLGIVTGKSRRVYEVTDRYVALSRLFPVAVVEDDVPHPKPDPEGLVRALEELRVHPRDAAYVGDTVWDLEAATRAGVQPVSARWGVSAKGREHLQEHAPEGSWTLDNPAELLGWVSAE